jgi:hypothetical protein
LQLFLKDAGQDAEICCKLELKKIENGKIEIGILIFDQIAIVFERPNFYFIPDMTFLVSIRYIHNSWKGKNISLI